MRKSKVDQQPHLPFSDEFQLRPDVGVLLGALPSQPSKNWDISDLIDLKSIKSDLIEIGKNIIQSLCKEKKDYLFSKPWDTKTISFLDKKFPVELNLNHSQKLLILKIADQREKTIKVNSEVEDALTKIMQGISRKNHQSRISDIVPARIHSGIKHAVTRDVDFFTNHPPVEEITFALGCIVNDRVSAYKKLIEKIPELSGTDGAVKEFSNEQIYQLFGVMPEGSVSVTWTPFGFVFFNAYKELGSIVSELAEHIEGNDQLQLPLSNDLRLLLIKNSIRVKSVYSTKPSPFELFTDETKWDLIKGALFGDENSHFSRCIPSQQSVHHLKHHIDGLSPIIKLDGSVSNIFSDFPIVDLSVTDFTTLHRDTIYLIPDCIIAGSQLLSSGSTKLKLRVNGRIISALAHCTYSVPELDPGKRGAFIGKIRRSGEGPPVFVIKAFCPLLRPPRPDTPVEPLENQFSTKFPYRMIVSQNEADDAIDSLVKEDFIFVDSENVSVNGSLRSSFIQILGEHEKVTYLFDMFNPLDISKLNTLFRDPSKVIVEQNHPFENNVFFGHFVGHGVGAYDTAIFSRGYLPCLPGHSLDNQFKLLDPSGRSLNKSLPRKNWDIRPTASGNIEYMVADCETLRIIYQEQNKISDTAFEAIPDTLDNLMEDIDKVSKHLDAQYTGSLSDSLLRRRKLQAAISRKLATGALSYEGMHGSASIIHQEIEISSRQARLLIQKSASNEAEAHKAIEALEKAEFSKLDDVLQFLETYSNELQLDTTLDLRGYLAPIAEHKDIIISPSFQRHSCDLRDDQLDKFSLENLMEQIATCDQHYVEELREKRDDLLPQIARLNKLIEIVKEKVEWGERYSGKYGDVSESQIDLVTRSSIKELLSSLWSNLPQSNQEVLHQRLDKMLDELHFSVPQDSFNEAMKTVVVGTYDLGDPDLLRSFTNLVGVETGKLAFYINGGFDPNSDFAIPGRNGDGSLAPPFDHQLNRKNVKLFSKTEQTPHTINKIKQNRRKLLVPQNEALDFRDEKIDTSEQFHEYTKGVFRKDKISFRPRQANAIEFACRQPRTLVWMDTNGGKTFVSFGIFGRVLDRGGNQYHLVPTQSLIAQVKNQALEYTTIPEGSIIAMGGKITPEKRSKIYGKQKTVSTLYVMTYQTFRNDIQSGRIILKNTDHVIADEGGSEVGRRERRIQTFLPSEGHSLISIAHQTFIHRVPFTLLDATPSENQNDGRQRLMKDLKLFDTYMSKGQKSIRYVPIPVQLSSDFATVDLKLSSFAHMKISELPDWLLDKEYNPGKKTHDRFSRPTKLRVELKRSEKIPAGVIGKAIAGLAGEGDYESFLYLKSAHIALQIRDELISRGVWCAIEKINTYHSEWIEFMSERGFKGRQLTLKELSIHKDPWAYLLLDPMCRHALSLVCNNTPEGTITLEDLCTLKPLDLDTIRTKLLQKEHNDHPKESILLKTLYRDSIETPNRKGMIYTQTTEHARFLAEKLNIFFGREVCSAGIGGNHIKKENEKSLIKEALTKLHNDEITWVVGTSALLKGHDTTVGMVIEFSPLSSFIEQKQFAGRAGREKGERRLPVRYVIFSAGSFEERAALIGRYKMRRKD